MVFERFRRAGGSVGRVACYGKLPFDREFLRFNLDSDEARWLVSWVDGAHHVIAAADAPPPAQRDVELRVVRAHGGGRRMTAALIRPSTDGGQRSYPIAMFATLDSRNVRDRWHLALLQAEPVWEIIARDILNAAIADRAHLAEALEGVACPQLGVEVVAQQFEEAVRRPVGSPWAALTGAPPERARALAVTLVQLGRVQRAARGAHDGVALRLPLTRGDLDAATQVAVWVHLFSMVSGKADPWSAVVEVRRREAGGAESVCVFGREPTPEDLAHLLAGVGEPAVEDLQEPWEGEPPPEAQALVDRLLDSEARSVADLSGRIQ